MKKFKFVLFALLLSAPLLMGFQGPDDGGVFEFTEVQLAWLLGIVLPVLAQVYKVYKERGGAKPSSAFINWAIFILGAFLAFLWGDAYGFLNAIDVPAFNFSDPVQAVGQIFDLLGQVFEAGAGVIGLTTTFYLALKPLVFNRIPGLMTRNMIQATKAKK